MEYQHRIQGDTTNRIAALSISPEKADHIFIQRVLGGSRCKVYEADCLGSARLLLDCHAIGVVLCEGDLGGGMWRDALAHISRMATAPPMIVTSRLADERLWAEALNLGAWDVLAKPFESSELIRSVQLAWERWCDRAATAAKPMQPALKPMKAMTA
jgi:DNA-binding NtrC family response regulator